MTNWADLTKDLETILKLRTYPVAYKRLEDAKELEKINKVRRLDRSFLFCQLPGLVRTRGWTIGAIANGKMNDRCTRLHGLADATSESMEEESAMLSTTWFDSPEQAMKQQQEYPRIPKGGAIVLAPLAANKFEPDVVLLYGNPAQLMMVLCGLQKVYYEKFHFSFIGEGACTDALGKCYVEGKPSLAIPCFGERRFGEVLDEEMVLALPPNLVQRAIEGLKRLSVVGIKLPIPIHGAEWDPSSALAAAYGERS